MKIRIGFVSNSSSCSFIIALPKGSSFPDCPALKNLSKYQMQKLKREFKKLMNSVRYRVYEKDNKATYFRLTELILGDFYIDSISRNDGEGEIINLCNIWEDRKTKLIQNMLINVSEEENARRKRKK